MGKQQLAPLKYNTNRLRVYTTEEIDHCERSKAIRRYIETAQARAANSATAYGTRLQAFSQFVYRKMAKKEVDDLIAELQAGRHDPYDMLVDFLNFLRTSRTGQDKLSANVINATVRTAKKFMRFSKVKIDNEEFKERVQLLRKEKPAKTGIEKGDVTTLLNSCKDIRLKTALMGHAATGPRPVELCAVRNQDIDFMGKNPWIRFRKEYSKMREERVRPLTREFAQQCRIWNAYKYRTRRTTFYDATGKKFNHKVITPERKPTDLFFAHIHYNSEVTPEGIYSGLQEEFAKLVDMVYGNKVGRNAGNGKRRDITLKVFRDFVKSTISDAGHGDYSEWFIGHSGSTYYQKSEKERMEIFRKIEPYITYTDISGLEAKGADVDSKIQVIVTKNIELSEKVQSLEHKEDSLNQIADELVKIRAENKELKERLERMEQAAPIAQTKRKKV